MKTLDRHVGFTVFGAILVVLLVIVGLDVISAIVDELKDLEDNYTFVEAMIYVVATLPGRIYEYIPFAALVGSLVGLGGLASQSELIVMRSAGVPTLRIIWMVMKPAMVLMLLGLFISEYIAPPTEQWASKRRALAQYGESAVNSRYGLWNREADQYMHFNIVETPYSLKGVTIFDFDDQRHLNSMLFARTAKFASGNWQLQDVVITNVGEQETQREIKSELKWQTNLTPNVLRQLVVKAENLSVSGLWSFAQYMADQDLSAGEYLLAFWNKVLQPLGTASLVLVAISFVFGPLREVTMGFRVFIGVMVGIIFRTSQDMLGPASLVFGFQPIIAVLAPILICAIIGIFLIRRGR